MLRVRSRRSIFFSVYIFLIIFCPPIIPRLDVVLIISAAVMIMLKYKASFMSVVVKSRMFFWVKVMMFLATYMILLPLPLSAFIYNDTVQIQHYISLFNRYGLLIVVDVVCGTYLFLELKSYGYTLEDFLKFTFYAGAIESLFSICSLIFPGFKSMLVSIMLANTGSGLYSNTWYITVRAYGFANTLVDLFGLGVSIIASTCFLYGLFKEKKYMILSVFILISTILNSRTGLILYIVCIMGAILYLTIKGKIKYLFFGIMSVFLLFIIFNILMESNILNDSTKSWISSGIQSFQELLENGKAQSDSMGVLFQEKKWTLPDGIRLFIGTGHSRYEAKGYVHTDVGYVNEIWMCGLIGAIGLYTMFIKFIYSAVKRQGNILAQCIGIMIFLGYFIFNIKGVAFGYNPGAAVILLILFAMNYFPKEKGNERNV